MANRNRPDLRYQKVTPLWEYTYEFGSVSLRLLLPQGESPCVCVIHLTFSRDGPFLSFLISEALISVIGCIP